MMRLSGSPPGRWRGSGDDRWVWIENFGRRHYRNVIGTGTGQSGRPTRGSVGPGYERAGSADAARSWAWAGQEPPALSFTLRYPFESTLNGQTRRKTTHWLGFPTYSNSLPAISYATRALRCHRRCVPFPLFFFRVLFDSWTFNCLLTRLVQLGPRTRLVSLFDSLMPEEETGPGGGR